MRVVILVLLALTLPTLATASTPIPESVYLVLASHATYGEGSGSLWGHPRLGARLWLDHGEWGFTIGGEQDARDTPVGTMIVDQWRRGNNERFVGTYFEEGSTVDDNVDFAAAGGGHLHGWTIVVYGHT